MSSLFSSITCTGSSPNAQHSDVDYIDEAQNYNSRPHRQTLEHAERFNSIFTYNTAEQFKSTNKYGAFEEDELQPDPNPLEADKQELEQSSSSTTNRLVEYACTGLSSALFALTLPFSLFFAVKFVGPSERLVVMRLGKTRGVYGQGTVLLLPLVDKATTVDLRLSSVELPPIHVLTADRGLLEVVAVAYARVSDPLTVCCALQNREQLIHSLAYTALTRHLTKRLLSDIVKPESLAKILVKCKDELNTFLRPHGVQVERLIVNQLKVLKQAENAAISLFQTLFKSEFGQQLMDKVGAHFQPNAAAPVGAVQSQNLQQKTEEADPKLNANSTIPAIPVDPELDALMGRIRLCLCEQLVQKVGRHFRILCMELEGAEFDIDMRNGQGWCGWTWERAASTVPPDVHFTLAKSTLVSLVDGTLSPMSAYLDGLVQVKGSVQDAIALRHLAECVANSTAKGGTTTTKQLKKSQ